jgi:hypothetical protein
MEFSVKMTTLVLYNYLLRQAYTGFSGWFGNILGVMMIALYFVEGNFQGVYWALIAGLVVIFYTPLNLLSKAKKQMLFNQAFKNPLHYTVNEEGIQVSQNDQTVLTPWGQLYKAVSTGKSIIIYTSRYHAWIFPRKDLADQENKLIEMISTHMPPARVKIKL